MSMGCPSGAVPNGCEARRVVGWGMGVEESLEQPAATKNRDRHHKSAWDSHRCNEYYPITTLA